MGSVDDLTLERAVFDVERDGFDLFRAACLLPRVAGRDGDVARCVEQVEHWGHALRAQGKALDEAARTDLLVHTLFRELDFCGDRDEYDAPRNSFVVDVLERRRGLPIALSLITIAVAEAAGIKAFGVALPRHFAVGVNRGDGFVLIDPFHRGRLLGADDVEKLTGISGLDVIGHAVTQTSPRTILMRMLANLHGSYLRRGERTPLVRVLSRMLLFEPRHPALLVQRSQVLAEEGELSLARVDAEAALGLSPDQDTQRAATEMIKRLDDAGRYVN